MLEDDPRHSASPAENADDNADNADNADDADDAGIDAYLGVAQDDADDAGAEELDGPENVLDRLDRMADPGSSSIQLEKIPPRLWRQTLAPVRRQQRMWLARRVPDQALRELAIDLASNLEMAEADAADARRRATNAALRTGYPLPSPGPGRAAARSSVQINIRLRRDDHERLSHAATAVGLKPTTLARSLVLNGAAMILREHGREHLAPPPRPVYTPLRLD